ncbi:hypothetical protein HNQ91_005882 [Filimonas zeae]|uniref:HNH endonuclease 5 domain-containing protein n=1 Tax=Filimonas zeae TaxID=1737353 RepID=A0A917MZ45_9BACT|nr:HNH endonuclease [Filimonas zeae]MDR6342795.1 hypothetical protein [Filimonas zeae]GGH82737.1 hypothetical protein GCM10011379_57070 [Filimonas zeae]
MKILSIANTPDDNQIIQVPDMADSMEEELDEFLQNYDLDSLVTEPDGKPGLKIQALRTCRFCGKKKPEVTFRKVAHTIPQLMGNQFLISDFECDACNELFNRYEGDLTAFMGLSRTLSLTKGKRGVPGYGKKEDKLQVAYDKEVHKINIIFDGLDNEHYQIDEQQKTLTVHTVKRPYVPINVFRIFLKMGLCYMDAGALAELGNIFGFLRDNSKDAQLVGNPLFNLYTHTLPGKLSHCLVLRFKRKLDAAIAHCPKYSFVIYSGSKVFQFYMPFHLADHATFSSVGNVHLSFCPPFLSKGKSDLYGVPRRRRWDQSVHQKISGENEMITLRYDDIRFYGDGETPDPS